MLPNQSGGGSLDTARWTKLVKKRHIKPE